MKTIFNTSFIFCLIIIVTACNQEPRYEGYSIFRYNESAGITSLDPAFSKDQPNIWVCNQLFNGLVQMDEQLIVKPCIAKRWSISEDGLYYRFVLRDDVSFHENECFSNKTRRVNAYDFVYSFDRLLDPNLAAPGAWVFQNVESYQALSDSVLTITLKTPFTPFLGLLSMKYCSVLPKEAVDYYKEDFGRNPVGTGPFTFKVWYENEKLILLRNGDYFEKEEGKSLPYLDAVAISFIPDKQSAFLEFAKGNLDFLNSLDAGYKDEILTPEGKLSPIYAESVEMQKLPFLNTEYLAINMKSSHPAFQNQQFRQALNYAFDRKEMIKYLRNDIGKPSHSGIIPKGLPSFLENPKWGYNYDPDKARRLIAESELNFEGLPPLELVTTSNYRELCEYVQGALVKIGIELNVNVVPASHLRELKSNGEADFFRASWIADYPDGENYLSIFYSKNFTPNGPNYTFFENDKFDEWYLKSRAMVSDSLKILTYQKCDSLVMHHAPIIPLYYDEVIRFNHKNVRGMKGNGLNVLDLRRVYKMD